MDLVWQSTAKPRKLHSPRLASESSSTHGNCYYRKIVPWTPPPQLCPPEGHPGSEMHSQGLGAAEDPAFRFAKFRLANPPGQSKRRRSEEYPRQPTSPEPQSVLPPITNEQIADRRRRKRLTRAERNEKMAAEAAEKEAQQKRQQNTPQPQPFPLTPKPRTGPIDYNHYNLQTAQVPSYSPVPAPLPGQRDHGDPPRRTRKELFA